MKVSMRGCRFVVSEHLWPAILDLKAINDRIYTRRLQGRWFNISLISVYAPKKEASDDKDAFYVPGQDLKVILGYLNAKVGKYDDVTIVAGKYNQNKKQQRPPSGCCLIHSFEVV